MASEKKEDTHVYKKPTRGLSPKANRIVTLAFIAFVVICFIVRGFLGSGNQQQEEIYYSFRNESTLNSHFDKHGSEFTYENAYEYQDGANKVIHSPDALHKTEAEDGDDIYYIEETNEFVVLSTDGFIRTYFKPSDGIDYYNRQ